MIAHASFFAADPTVPALTQQALIAVGLALIAMGGLAILARMAEPIVYDPTRKRCLVRFICERLSFLAPHSVRVPTIARVGLGATLLLSAATGNVLSPAETLDHSATIATLVQLLAGAALVFGVAVRSALVGIAALFVLVGLEDGVLVALGRADIAGLAVFVWITSELRPAYRMSDGELRRFALGGYALRVGVALGLLITAVVEKLASGRMTIDVLASHPQIDPTTILPIDQASFIVGAGMVELLFAMLVLAMPLPDIAAIALAAPFVLSVPAFGPAEIVGHLPIYTAFAVVLLLGVHPQARESIRRLPWSSRNSNAQVVGERFPWSERPVEVEQPVEGSQLYTFSFGNLEGDARPPLPDVFRFEREFVVR
jgi:hypothetical protein